MKKLIITLGALLLLSAGISSANATDVHPYFDLHGGATVADDSSFNTVPTTKVSFDTGFVAGGAIGLDFDLLRLEANVDYRRSTVSKVDGVVSNTGNMQLLSYMVNAHLVAPIKFEAKPYLLGGLGFATAYIDKPSKQNDTKFAYQAGVGIGYEIKRNVAIDFNYRYLGTSDFDMGNEKMSYASNNVMLGIRYSY